MYTFRDPVQLTNVYPNAIKPMRQLTCVASLQAVYTSTRAKGTF